MYEYEYSVSSRNGMQWNGAWSTHSRLDMMRNSDDGMCPEMLLDYILDEGSR
jgi:hypothetical protein